MSVISATAILAILQVPIVVNVKKKAGLGDSCSDEIFCSTPYSSCYGGMCQCDLGCREGFSSATCELDIKELGDICFIDAQCIAGGAGSESECMGGVPGFCACTTSAVEGPWGGCLGKATIIGDSCSINEQCANLPNSICDPNYMNCVCDSGYYEEAGTCRKLQDAELGDPCTEDSDCIDPNSECKDGTGTGVNVCQCKLAFFPFGKTCYSIINDLGAACEIDSQCAVQNSFCRLQEDGNSSSVCACHDDFFKDFNTCLPKKDIGEACQKDGECRDPWAICDNNICTCQQEFYFDPWLGECARKKQLGESCSIDIECGMFDDFAICNGLVCMCREEAIEYDYQCYKKVQIIGESCQVPSQCVFEHGVCVDSKCACDIGYSAQNNTCITSPVLGGNCTSNQHCTVFGSECSSKGVCECKSGFVGNTELQTCHEIRYVVNDPCDIDEQCTAGNLGEHSFCNSNFSNEVPSCHCRDLAVYDPATTRQVCYPKQLELDSPCVINQQCSANLGRYAHCNENSCTCVAHAVPDPENTFCYPIVDYSGSPCEIKRQCINGNLGSLSDCLESSSDDGNKYCECKFSPINDPNLSPSRCFEKRHYLNKTCDIDHQCNVNIGALSHCSQDRICKCQKNSGKPSQDGTKCIPA